MDDLKTRLTDNKTKLELSSMPQNVKQLDFKYRDYVENQNNTYNTVSKIDFLKLLLFILACVIVICSFGSWISIAGYEFSNEINLFQLIVDNSQISEWGDYYFVIAGKEVSVIGLIWAIEAIILGIAIIYSISICQLFWGKKYSIVYFANYYVVIVIIICIVFKVWLDNEMENIVEVQLSPIIWLVLAMSCIMSLDLLYKNRNYNQHLLKKTAIIKSQQQVQSLQNLFFTVRVTNSYPWENIKFSKIVFEPNGKSLLIEYSLDNKWMWPLCNERAIGDWTTKIRADILLETDQESFVLEDCQLEIEILCKEGKTQKISIENNNFDIERVKSAKILIRNIDSPILRSSQYFNFYAIEEGES